jgi:riboflavin kinase / FMN adenylyltransferase
MKIISATGKADKPRLANTVVAIGIFDGVHEGHQFLIRRMVACARRKKAKSLVVTFHPHPAQVLHKREISYLVSLPHRLKIIEELGVDIVMVIRFTKKFAHQKPEQFVKDYLVGQLGVKEVFVGDDFRFGENRAGDVDFFSSMGKKYGFKVNHLHPVKRTKEKISSTSLRELIRAGRLDEAASMLGRRVALLGKVVRGDGRGKKLGYPTANIKFDCDVLPPKGVYMVELLFEGKRYSALANIGIRPSFKSREEGLSLEVHVLDFHKNIYNREVIVEFLKKIRDEQKFSSPDALVAQIRKDEQKARAYFKGSSRRSGAAQPALKSS